MQEGRVTVNGQVVRELGTKVDPDSDDVRFDGRRVELEAFRWIAYHKPRGVITTRSDPRGRSTIYDRLPPEMSTLKYVGRLDRDTGGLLLLSNEGEVIHRLLGSELIEEIDAPRDEATSGGPPRRYYTLTAAGRVALQAELRRMDEVVRYARGIELLGGQGS